VGIAIGGTVAPRWQCERHRAGIQRHDGQGAGARDRYAALDADRQAALRAFLLSL